MSVSRRGFLASLIAVPAGLMAAAKATAARIRKQEASQLTHIWFQTTRVMHFSTLEYEDAIDAIMIPDERERRRNWHERRKDRCRARIALLKTQRPLPLP